MDEGQRGSGKQKWISKRFSDAFNLRRSQILLASSREQHPKTIASNLGCATQTVRNAILAFEEKGVACLTQESSRPKTVQAQFDQATCEALCALLHQSPRTFSQIPSYWNGTARGQRWRAHHPVLAAYEESLAEPKRTQAGPQQASDCRTCSAFTCE